MNKNKHLSLAERITIKSMLDHSVSFKGIGRTLGRDCTTISKEVRNHFSRKPAALDALSMTVPTDVTVLSPDYVPTLPAGLKSAAFIQNVTLIARIIERNSVLLYPGLHMSATAVPKKHLYS